MATIPDFTALGPTPQPQPSYRRVFVDQSGEILAHGAEQVGRSLEQIGNEIGTRNAVTLASNRLSDFRLDNVGALDQAKGNLGKQPSEQPGGAAPLSGDAALNSQLNGLSGFAPGVLADFDQRAQKLTQGVSPLAARMLQAGIASERERVGSHAIEWAGQQRDALAAGSVGDNLTKLAPLVEGDPSRRTDIGGQLMAQIAGSGLAPSVQAQLKRSVIDTLATAAGRGLANQDPMGTLKRLADPNDTTFEGLTLQQRGALEQYANGQAVSQTVDSVLSAFKSSRVAGASALLAVGKSDLAPEQQAQVVQAVQRGRSDFAQMAQQDPANRNRLTTLDDAIAQGTVSPGSLQSVESLWGRGVLTDEQHTVKRDAVLRGLKKGVNDQEDLAYVSHAYDTRTPLYKDQDGAKVNLFLAMTTMGQPPGSPAYNNAAVEITSRVGVVPKSAIEFGNASMVGGEAPAAAKGAQLLASLQRANPRAYTEATNSETRAMAMTINDAVTAGTQPETAVTMARENAQRSQTMQKFLDDAWNKQRAPGQNWLPIEQNLVKAGLKEDPHYAESGILGFGGKPVPQVPESMAGEFQSLSREYFNHTGNLQQAHALALNDLKSTWGVSEVNGQRQLMKYAPESMVPGLTAEAIRSDLAREGYGAARLKESPETGASGGLRWSLEEPDKFGAWDVVRGADNMAVRYQLPRPDPKANSFETELQTYDDRERLRGKRERENYAAEHPIQQPGF